MTQKFSKLNRIGNTFKQNKSKQKPNFSIGQNKTETSSDSDEEYENSIFQPNMQSGTSFPYTADSSFNQSNNSIEQGLEVTENSLISPKLDTYLPGVGIVMGNKNEGEDVGRVLELKQNLFSRADSSQLDDVQLSSIMQNVSISGINQAPEIKISSDSEVVNKKNIPPNTLKLEKKFSHSSGEVDDTKDIIEYKSVDPRIERSTSDYDVQLNISQSLSESALKSKFSSMTNSPVATVTKDLVLSPFSKLAKGVQNIGVNLDPRRLSGQVRHVTEREMEEHKKLQEKWRNSKTRLVAL